MTIRRDPNDLTKATIVERLCQRFPAADVAKLSKLGQVELLERGVASGVLTVVEVQATLPARTRTVKAYLRTFVKDQKLLDNVNKYVRSTSLMRAYASRLLNLGAMDMLGGARSDQGPVERYVLHVDAETRAMFDLLERDTCKHAFAPDAWTAGDQPAPPDEHRRERSKRELDLDPTVQTMWRHNTATPSPT